MTNVRLHCLPTHEHTLQECPPNTFAETERTFTAPGGKPREGEREWGGGERGRERTWTLAEPWSHRPPLLHRNTSITPHTAQYGTAATTAAQCLSQCGGSFEASSLTNNIIKIESLKSLQER